MNMIYFPIVVLAYYVLPDKYKKIWLLVINYYFCISFSVESAIFLQIITIITYCLGRYCDKLRLKKAAGKIACIGGVVCILLLCMFKILTAVSYNFLVVVGISFYSLQAAGYVIDVYEKNIEVEKNYLNYSVFLSFFPTLQSGPIERAKTFLPQLSIKRQFDYEKVKNGMLLMLWGYLEKIAVADMLAIYVNGVYDNYSLYSGASIILATILYAFELYADFAGYSNIAVGAAQVLGYDLTLNFRQPYLSRSVQEFWRRWHISLNNWLIEYIYIPFGGSRKGNLRRYINIMIVFLISGLWHGTNVTFLVWGGLNGLYIILEDIIKKMGGYCTDTKYVCWLQRIKVFVLIDFAWMFFRADSLTMVGELISKICTKSEINVIFVEIFNTGVSQLQIFFAVIGLIVIIAVDIAHNKDYEIRTCIAKLPLAIRWGIYYILVLGILTVVIANMGIDASNFIYGQF